MDTIYALASARGKSGVAVIRISGPGAWGAVALLAGDVPKPRFAALRRLRLGADVLDDAIVVTFAKGASFTGEESAELQLHGATATVSAVLGALAGMAGLRLAEPGEFTRRALENGRLDLAQVEGLADLIESETEAQRRQAMRVLSGQVGERAEGWRRDLIRAAALLEATIDFADEDVPEDVGPEVVALLTGVEAKLRREIAGFGAAERIREGFEVAIVGQPNAGKSTLLNALAGREAAITSEVAGTTRDVIEVRMDLSGLAVTFLDTAGLRQTEDLVEGIGVRRALERARQADLRVFLVEASGTGMLEPGASDIIVRAKADLLAESVDMLGVSGKTGAGLGELIALIGERLSARVASAGVITRVRHKSAIENALKAMESARLEISKGPDRIEFAAENVRAATRALDSLVGRVDVEHLLDEIFSSFCIGK
ncbi:tRNA modification GTPase MnmE [Defluviimonas aquaemixtae]|uniref:tRNA modification GTPase MnmE n=1 Tax=Albidovulum aquaemixtae TaxID=1542388 RepID=A0A2R8BJJ3_9RHOB|nr:tRNA uridine-5-carboxymethylaminomethyl(34) synthesis GTPase MnmE [Defluviimonas aquaemixtae]SPH23548.1 tRNA modification GTPase MnmE [Defluviimonas aquaemixtae]